MNPILIVGIEDYGNAAETLPGCLNDVRTWERVLRSQFKITDIAVLSNNKADRASVENSLAHILTLHTDQFPAVFVYAGHGDRIKRASFTEDVLVFRTNDGPLSGDFSSADLARLMKKHLPENVERPPILILDCCYSGGILGKRADATPRMRSSQTQNTNRGVKKSGDHRSFGHPLANESRYVPLVLAAAGPDQSAWDAVMTDKKRHGLFSFVATSILNQTPSLTYDDLIQQVKSTIAKDYEFDQVPEVTGSRQDRDHSFLK
jgi:hypothetical protein